MNRPLSCAVRWMSAAFPSDKKAFIAEGPSLGEFISGEVSPDENPYKRKKGRRYGIKGFNNVIGIFV